MKTCKEIVKILSDTDNISPLVKMELRVHLFMCKHCSNYSQHLKSMKNGFVQLFKNLTYVKKERIENLENKVIEKLKKHGS